LGTVNKTRIFVSVSGFYVQHLTAASILSGTLSINEIGVDHDALLV